MNAYLDGIQLPSYIVNTVENALDITSVYKRIQYCMWFLFIGCFVVVHILTEYFFFGCSENRCCPSMVYIPFHSIRSHHTVHHFFSCGPS